MMQVEAVYENGVLRPLQPLELMEHERVMVSVHKTEIESKRSAIDTQYVERLRAEMGGGDSALSLEEVRQRLAKIPGSMAADLVAERGER